MAEKRGLGRGLGAVFAAAGTGTTGANDSTGTHDSTGTPGATGAAPPLGVLSGAALRELAPASITPNPRQPRQVFDAESLAELVHSIREVGILQPVVVREIAPERYELIMGERRWRAAQEAGLTSIPAIVRHTEDDAMLRDALLENLHRQQLNALEEAAAYQQLLVEFGATHEELASRIGRSRPQISNTIRLLQLPATVQRRVAAGILSAGHARALLGLADAQAQEHLAGRIVAEGLSVRAVEELVSIGSGEAGGRPRRARTVTAQPEAAGAAQTRLADRLETRVSVEVGKAKGRISIDFADLVDLARIIDLIEGP
jgi:ParB family chromosome partitioning protein